MKLLDIAEVSEKAGLPPSTLRYYDEIGLITPAGRKGLRRQFTPDAVLQLALIEMGKMAGFSLDEIAGMFGSDAKGDVPREPLRRKADGLDRQIRRMKTLRDLLRHVAECPAPSHMECPTFRRLVELAARHGRTARSRN